jgi:hypothetical protein
MTPEATAACLDIILQKLREHEQRWVDLHKMLANERNAAIMQLGGLEDFLNYPRSVLPKRDKVLGEKV